MRRFVSISAAVVTFLVAANAPGVAQTPPHYRAFWVETFNTLLNRRPSLEPVAAQPGE
jgi:hypothetical protein